MGQESESRKTFVVSVLTGVQFGTPWPLGRLHISDETITVRSMFTQRTSPKSRITEISLQKYNLQNCLLFKASSEIADVAVTNMIRYKAVVAELRRRGYPVVDRRPTFFPLPQGTVPWPDQDRPRPPEPPPS